jgi:rfaE bifunctional protein nucleotidyltransferase chain/domain
MDTKNKIKSLPTILAIVRKLKKQNKKIVTTNGVFDIIHPGHISSLEKAKSLGDVLIVAINSDSSVKQNKGDKRPINGHQSRMKVIAGLASTDYVFLFNQKDPSSVLAKIKPHIHVKAADYSLDRLIERKAVEDNGGKIILTKIEGSYSSTAIINKIKSLL